MPSRASQAFAAALAAATAAGLNVADPEVLAGILVSC
jgi:hypothetical protein